MTPSRIFVQVNTAKSERSARMKRTLSLLVFALLIGAVAAPANAAIMRKMHVKNTTNECIWVTVDLSGPGPFVNVDSGFVKAHESRSFEFQQDGYWLVKVRAQPRRTAVCDGPQRADVFGSMHDYPKADLGAEITGPPDHFSYYVSIHR
jgi:hypothetical protein